jgi:hypothetical protein
MKFKSIIQYTVVFLAGFSCFSCSDYLDKTPDEDMSLQDVFAERQYAERYLTTAYVFMPLEGNLNDDFPSNLSFTGNPFIGASDEMDITWTYTLSNKINSGAWNAQIIQDCGNLWYRDYKGIRQCNLFLENIGATPMDEHDKQVWMGEVHFLRAFYHFLLLRSYGPIPVLDHSISMGDNFNIPRNPFDECVAFIVKDCDEALRLGIPMRVTPAYYGRVTAAAALALKARVLLYAASPLFNGNPDYESYANPDGVKLFSPKDDSKWQKAADAAKECIDRLTAGNVYELYKAESGNPMDSYTELFIQNWNKEVIFARPRGATTIDPPNNWHSEMCTSPNGMGGWSGLCPTQEMVDAYQMANGENPITGYNADGSPIINAASGYVETGYASVADPDGYYPAGVRNMYVGREPRFYASINFSGQLWRGRGIEFWRTGRDGSAKSSVDYTTTGYLKRKFSDPDVNLVQGTGYSFETAVFFRLGEIYLNYAEALNEAQGPVADVYRYVNLIRERAGLSGLPAGLNKDAMREKIRHERRIELAFETHRYFDCHRWKIAEVTDNKEIYGMSISRGTRLSDDSFYERMPVEKRIFSKQHYLWPIPQNEIDKTKSLVQSPFWQSVEETQ